MEEENEEPLSENRSGANNPERSNYWEELLKDRYEVHKVEEFNSMGKGKRSRKQVGPSIRKKGEITQGFKLILK